MPERQCYNCQNKDEWGCKAVRHTTVEDDPYAEWDAIEGNWVRWTKGALHPIELDGQMTRACPRQHIHEHPVFWRRLLLLYGMYAKGFLPEQGAVLDQSNQLLELFRILDIANADCDSESSKPERPKGNPFEARGNAHGRKS